MRALAWVWLAGALLIVVSAGIRSAKETPRRSHPKPVTSPPTEETSQLDGMADPGSDDQVEILSESFPVVELESASDVVQDLLAETDPRDDPIIQLTASWDAWRKQAIAALPEHLREDSDHRRGIDETYRAAIANLGAPDRAVASDRSVLHALQAKVQSVRTRASLALVQAVDRSATELTEVSVSALLVRLAEPVNSD